METVFSHVLFSCCLKITHTPSMSKVELIKIPILPEEYKIPLLFLSSLQPAFCSSIPKALQRLAMSAVAPLPKHKDFRIMIIGDVYALQ